MKISCRYCGIVDKPHKCPRRAKKAYDRSRIDNKVYESKEYRKTRRKVLDKYNSTCLFSLYVDGRKRKATVTHHIIEVLEDETKGKDFNNLIPLSDMAHKIVHELYKINKKETQDILFSMLNDYKAGNFKLKKYKEKIEKIRMNKYPI